jgi:YHS domain-containing protein
VHETLALRYGLSALPATVLLQPDGQVIDVRQGFAGAAEFRTFLEEALKRSGRPYAPVRVPAARTGDGVALAGFCPVSLVADHRLVPGQPGITVSYDGRIYRFASAQGLESFRRQPERFIPVNSGYCPVAQIDRGEVRGGSPKAGVLYEGHLYLCADDASRQLFLKSPRRYAHVDVADRGFCPHCWSMEKLVVRGRPQCSLTRGGHRYLFPDFKHLEAYRAATETVRR